MSELKSLVRLAVPLALAQVGMVLMGFVDVAVVGRLGPVPLAAVGLGNGLFFAVSVFGIGAMMGLDPLVSQALGAGQPQRARAVLWQGVWLAVFASAVLAVPIIAAAFLLEWAGVVPEVARDARTYALVRLPALVPMLLFSAQKAYLQAHRVTRPMVISIVIANVANLGLDWLLVLGVEGVFPPLGAAGVALATVTCTVLQVSILGLGIRLMRVPAPDVKEGAASAVFSRRPRPKEMGRALRVGLPVGLQMGAEVGVFALAGLLAARMGAELAAAHQVALSLASLSFCAAVGVGSAGSVMVGHAVGAGSHLDARRAGKAAVQAGTMVMSVGALAFLLVPGPLVRMLTDVPEVIRIAVPLLAVAAAFQLSDGLQAVGAGILRGAGDTRFAFVANLLGHWLIGLPVALLCAEVLGLGLVGIWWGLAAGLTVVAAALMLRFFRLTSRPMKAIDHREPVEQG